MTLFVQKRVRATLDQLLRECEPSQFCLIWFARQAVAQNFVPARARYKTVELQQVVLDNRVRRDRKLAATTETA